MLAGLDLQVRPGELVVVQGANGAGKTTLIRILSTLTRPTSGDFTVGGISGVSDPELVRCQIGVMLHHPMVYGDLSAAENLRFQAALSGRKDFGAQISGRLVEVGLDPANTRPVRNYSRGMQQRLSIARALLCDPAVLLLDEPFTGLDALNQDRFIDLLVRLRESGKTILATDHDPGRAVRIATRIDYLFQGKICRSFQGDELNPSLLSGRIAEIERGNAVATTGKEPVSP